MTEPRKKCSLCTQRFPESWTTVRKLQRGLRRYPVNGCYRCFANREYRIALQNGMRSGHWTGFVVPANVNGWDYFNMLWPDGQYAPVLPGLPANLLPPPLDTSSGLPLEGVEGSMAKKTTKKKPVSAPTPSMEAAPKPREFPAPPWRTREKVYGNSFRLALRQMCADITWHLPPFQREVVWDAEKQAAYCNTLFLGLPTSPILVWERYVGDGARRYFVLDGQQRLTAMGARVIRADGSPNPPTGAFFDHAEGRFTTEPGRWATTMTDLADYKFGEHMRMERAMEEDPETQKLWYWRIFAYDRISNVEGATFVLEHSTPPARVVDAFRSINRPGVLFSEAEVERLIASTQEFAP